MSEQIKFFKGEEKDLPKSGIKQGALYYCTDTGNTYIGTSTTSLKLWSTNAAMQQDNGGVIIGKGDASGAYSIAGGTNEKNLVNNIFGSYGSFLPNIKTSKASGVMSTSYGANNTSIAAGSNSLGLMNKSGCMGYYVQEVLVGGKKIKVSKDQTSIIDPNKSILEHWIGCTITINDGETTYANCAEVEAIEESNIVVLKQALPFTELKTRIIKKPDDKMVIAIPPINSIDLPLVGSQETYRPEIFGEVEFGWFSNTSGFDNIAAGKLSTATGMSNTALDTAAFVSGRSNIGSTNTLVGGYNNKVLSEMGFAVGKLNTVNGKYAAAVGNSNIVNGNAGFAEG